MVSKRWIAGKSMFARIVVCSIICIVASVVCGDVIVDNGDPGTTFTGTWKKSISKNCYGADSVWASDGETYTWRFDSEPEGVYEVLMWWSGAPSRAKVVEVSIDHAGGPSAVLIDQRAGSGSWNSLGEYSFKGSGSVTMKAATSSRTSTCADAVWFRRLDSAGEIVIDNRDRRTSRSGKWVVSKEPDCYGSDSVWGSNRATFTWYFVPSESGEYEVSMWWTEAESRSKETPVDVRYAGGKKRVIVNQQTDGGRWNSLGVYSFKKQVKHSVTLWARGRYPMTFSADAVKFVMVDKPPVLEPVKADFKADHTRGPVPFTVNFTNQSDGEADEWHWDFGDGGTSKDANPTHTYTTPGTRTVLLTATKQGKSHTCMRYSYVDVKAAKTENIYVCNGYGGNDYLVPDLTKKMREMNATVTDDGWVYRPANSDMTYNIRVLHDNDSVVNAFYEKDAHVVIAGHANYGFGLVFADKNEILANRIDRYRYVDDDCLVNYSTDWVSTKVDGMKYGQSYPNWEPVFKDGRSALMPYDFGDPQGNPPYNYYLTYLVAGDPTHYRIELNGSYLERFPDSGVAAWYSPQGIKPDPKNNQEYYITNPDVHYNRFDCVGEWAMAKLPNAGFTGDAGYMGYNYQVQWPGSGSKSATWTMAVKQRGQYEVFATWPALSRNATNAKYTIHHAEGSTIVTVDQTHSKRRNSLGVFTFDAGPAKIELDDQANGDVIADSMVLWPVADTKKILKAEFSADSRAGEIPLTVNFKNRSAVRSYDYGAKITEWHWDFGDGATSREPNPSHTYRRAGMYTVKLRVVDNSRAHDTEAKTHFICIGTRPPLRAQFRASNIWGLEESHISFNDQSSGDISEWSWDFGDGGRSSDRNPVHKYSSPGTYTVRLTVAGAGGSSTEIEENYIHIMVGECFADNTFQTKPHYYSRGYSTFGMVICYAGKPSIDKSRLRHSRLFHGSCGSFTYFGTTFDRGVMYGKQGVVEIENDTSTTYLEWYLRGYPDQDICERLNRIEDNHYFYNFNEKPPSMQ